MSYEGLGVESPVASPPRIEMLSETTFLSFPVEVVS